MVSHPTMARVPWLCMALVAFMLGCGTSREVRLERRIGELEGKVFDARQRAGDLKVRMQRIIARNRVLIGLVEGLTTEPDQAPAATDQGPLASAHRALEALDRDIDVLATTLKRSREDIVELHGERKELKSNLNDAVKRIEEAKKREELAQERIETFRAMLLRLRAMIDNNALELRIVRNQMVVKLPEAVLFDTGKAKLKPEGQDLLKEVAGVLTEVQGRDFQVAGHTDDVPIANWRYPSNWHLSAARAITVARFLVTHGVEPHRIGAAGYADTRPVSTERTPEARRLNRRIEIALMPSLDELPDLTGVDQAARDEKPAGEPHDDEAAVPEFAAPDALPYDEGPAPPGAPPAASDDQAPAAKAATKASEPVPSSDTGTNPGPEAKPLPPAKDAAPAKPEAAPAPPAEPPAAEPGPPVDAKPAPPAEPPADPDAPATSE